MNAVDEARFASRRERAGRHGAATDRFVMMYHGTLTRIYGLDIAIEAFGIAQQEMPGAELWILGSGPEQGPLAEPGRAARAGIEGQADRAGRRRARFRSG